MVRYYCPFCGESFEHHDIDDPNEIYCTDEDFDGYCECICQRCGEVVHRCRCGPFSTIPWLFGDEVDV